MAFTILTFYPCPLLPAAIVFPVSIREKVSILPYLVVAILRRVISYTQKKIAKTLYLRLVHVVFVVNNIGLDYTSVN